MATKFKSRARRSRRFLAVAKPSGSLHPRVQKVGPEHFGIVAVDCAKARSKWMLADFYGRILVPPTVVEQTARASTRPSPRSARPIDNSRPPRRARRHRADRASTTCQSSALSHQDEFETRIVHPLTTKQFRLPADPGNKTDDTDLFAIHRAAANGFGLIEPQLDETHGPTPAAGAPPARPGAQERHIPQSDPWRTRCSLAGLSRPVGDVFDHEPALAIARGVQSAREVRALGTEGLAQLLEDAQVRYQRRTLAKILAWADGIDSTAEILEMYHTDTSCHLDDERRGRLADRQAGAGNGRPAGADALRAALEHPRDQHRHGRRIRRRDGTDRQLRQRPSDHGSRRDLSRRGTRATRSIAATAPWSAAPTARCGT